MTIARVQQYLRKFPGPDALPPHQRQAGVTLDHVRAAAEKVLGDGYALRDGRVMREAATLVEREKRRAPALAIWQTIQPTLKRRLYESAYRMWIEPIEVTDLVDGILILNCSDAIRTWIERRYLDVIIEALEDNCPDVEGARFGNETTRATSAVKGTGNPQ